MKQRFFTRGYVRTVLLSVLAACIIEAVVNADEVRAAFAAGKGDKEVPGTRDSSVAWLKIPQHVSNEIGHFYHDIFETKTSYSY